MATDVALDAILDGVLGADAGTKREMTSNTDEKVTVYSTLTGEEKQILKIDARRVLAKRFPDGRYMHWMPGMPGERPKAHKGSVKCYLHPEFDETDGVAGFDRAWLDSIGLAGRHCNDGNPSNRNRDDFTSELERDEHVRLRHPRTWRVVENARVAAERRREAEERRADREAMLALATPKATEAAKPPSKG